MLGRFSDWVILGHLTTMARKFYGTIALGSDKKSSLEPLNQFGMNLPIFIAASQWGRSRKDDQEKIIFFHCNSEMAIFQKIRCIHKQYFPV